MFCKRCRTIHISRIEEPWAKQSYHCLYTRVACKQNTSIITLGFVALSSFDYLHYSPRFEAATPRACHYPATWMTFHKFNHQHLWIACWCRNVKEHSTIRVTSNTGHPSTTTFLTVYESTLVYLRAPICHEQTFGQVSILMLLQTHLFI